MRLPVRKTVLVLLAIVVSAALAIALPTVIVMVKGVDRVDPVPVVAIVAILAVAGLLGLVVLRHLRALERLRGAILTLLSDATERAPNLSPDDLTAEVARVGAAVDELVSHRLDRQAAPDERLTAVLGSIAEAIVVVTEAGQVSLVNAAAKELLGAERIAIGTSVFAALRRRTVEVAIGQAREAGRPVRVTVDTVDGEAVRARVVELGEHGGAVFSFSVAEVLQHLEVEHDLGLHDTPPPPGEITTTTPLAELAMLVFDCETTGLDVERDAIVSVGGVRMHGARIYRSAVIDRLVDPERPIPPPSTAIHGITDEMVAAAPDFAALWEILEPLLAGTVIVGHNIGFDIAHLAKATAEAGIEWTPPPFLDTLLLSAALEPGKPALGLDQLAERHGVNVRGRHTALGDSLMTAEIYQRMLPRLRDAGVVTLGDAIEFSKKPKHILRMQHRAGW